MDLHRLVSETALGEDYIASRHDWNLIRLKVREYPPDVNSIDSNNTKHFSI